MTKKEKTIAVNAKKANYEILQRIFNYFDPEGMNIEMMKKWIYDKDGLIIKINDKFNTDLIPNGCIITIFKYFQDEYQYLYKMMMEMSQKFQITMIDKLFTQDTWGMNREVREFLTNELSINVAKLINFKKIKVRKYPSKSIVMIN